MDIFELRKLQYDYHTLRTLEEAELIKLIPTLTKLRKKVSVVLSERLLETHVSNLQKSEWLIDVEFPKPIKSFSKDLFGREVFYLYSNVRVVRTSNRARASSYRLYFHENESSASSIYSTLLPNSIEYKKDWWVIKNF